MPIVSNILGMRNLFVFSDGVSLTLAFLCTVAQIYLRTVALCVYLTHVGSFVPASRSTVPLTDAIFTRMHSKVWGQQMM